MSIDYELSNAIVLCLSYKTASSPTFSGKMILERYGQNNGDRLLKEATRIIEEASQTNIDWANTSLAEAGNIVRRGTHNKYPTLSDEALDAVAWKFTFDWR